jgi:fimbrial chaperone protein
MRAFGSAVAAMLAAANLCSGAGAASFKVYPVRIVLTPKQAIQTMTIHNSGSDPVRVQLRVFAWRQVNGEDAFAETQDVLANPPLFQVGPNGDQIARFGLRVAPGSTEKSYRVFLQEVPGAESAESANPGQVRTLLRISIPIFVPAPNATGRLNWRLVAAGGRHVRLLVRNDGDAHVQINRLALVGRDGATLVRQDASIYLLPGSARDVALDAAAPIGAGQPIKLSAETDQGNISAEMIGEAAPREAGRP